MSQSHLLGQISNLHDSLNHLLEPLQDSDCNRQFHPQLSPIGWYYGRSVYLEALYLQEMIQGDDRYTRPVQTLFTPGNTSLQRQGTKLPPKDHLLNWGHERFEQHLMWLANPKQLPQHPLLENDFIYHLILQELSKNYEAILAVLNQKAQNNAEPYQAKEPLPAQTPPIYFKEVPRGVYLIGNKNAAEAYDNERPVQQVELSAFRIATHPIHNSAYHLFIQQGGYQNQHLWSQQGWQWQQQNKVNAPNHWRQDKHQNWYALGINGPYELDGLAPVMGINQHESQAFVNWLSERYEPFQGAILPHEFQWEMAARSGELQDTGRVWEWCSNSFHPYEGFQARPDTHLSEVHFEQNNVTLKGGALHTQKALRRASYRHFADPTNRTLFAGLRIVIPPSGEIVPTPDQINVSFQK
ncbi:MAG: SUMF1/EgtB/PvdO family nonheme iron enzyme [Gammaproteobacteria bacterium]|nr:SUMF1/EgtB/PvdO family nonheme iron enzyme [Gammaproteobacteria bacterium]